MGSRPCVAGALVEINRELFPSGRNLAEQTNIGRELIVWLWVRAGFRRGTVGLRESPSIQPLEPTLEAPNLLAGGIAVVIFLRPWRGRRSHDARLPGRGFESTREWKRTIVPSSRAYPVPNASPTPVAFQPISTHNGRAMFTRPPPTNHSVASRACRTSGDIMKAEAGVALAFPLPAPPISQTC